MPRDRTCHLRPTSSGASRRRAAGSAGPTRTRGARDGR